MSHWPPNQNCLGRIKPRSRRVPMGPGVAQCPVCFGTGSVPNGFYMRTGVLNWTTATTAFETCLTCDGLGIVRVRGDADVG